MKSQLITSEPKHLFFLQSEFFSVDPFMGLHLLPPAMLPLLIPLQCPIRGTFSPCTTTVLPPWLCLCCTSHQGCPFLCAPPDLTA